MISYEAIKAFTFYKHTVQFVAGIQLMQLGHENIGLRVLKDKSIDDINFSNSFKMISEIIDYYYEFPVTSANKSSTVSSFIGRSNLAKWKQMTIDVLMHQPENFAIYQYIHTNHFKKEFANAIRRDFKYDKFGRVNNIEININEIIGEFEKFLDINGAAIKAYTPESRTLDDFLFHCYHHYFKKNNDLKSIFNVIDLNKERGEGTSLIELRNSSDMQVDIHNLLQDIYTASRILFINIDGELVDDIYSFFLRNKYSEEMEKVKQDFSYIEFKDDDINFSSNAAHKLRCRRKLLDCFKELFEKDFSDYDVFRCFQAAMKLSEEYVPQKNGINIFYTQESKTNNTNSNDLHCIIKGIRAVNKLYEYAKAMGHIFIDSRVFRIAELNSRILTPDVLFNDYASILNVYKENTTQVQNMFYNSYIYDHIRSSVLTIHKVLSQLQNVNLSFLDTLIVQNEEKATPFIDKLLTNIDKLPGETVQDFTTLLIKIAEGSYEENDEILFSILFAKILSDFDIEIKDGTYDTNFIKLINCSKDYEDTFAAQQQVADMVIQIFNNKYHVNVDDLKNSINICGCFMYEYLKQHMTQIRLFRLNSNDRYALSCFAHNINNLNFNPLFLQYTSMYNVNYVNITNDLKILQHSGNSNIVKLSKSLMNATEFIRSFNTITNVVEIYSRLKNKFQSNSGYLFHGYLPIKLGDYYIHELGFKVKECPGGTFIQEHLSDTEVDILEQMYD